MSDVTTIQIRGKASYFKFVGDPRLNYQKDGKEWTTDVYDLSDKDIAKLKKAGIGDRIKSKDEYLDGSDYFTFKQKELTKDGKPNRRVPIFDAAGKPWPEGKLIGNGSVIDVKFVVMDYGKGMRKGVYPRGFRVLEHVPYESAVFEPLEEEDEFYTEDKEYEEFKKDFALDDLDDEIPE